MGRHSLLDDASIEAWIAENEPGGLRKLQTEVNLGRISGVRASHVREYLGRKAAFDAGLLEVHRMTMEARAVKAAERSAKWSGWAVAISLVSLAIAAYTLVRTG